MASHSTRTTPEKSEAWRSIPSLAGSYVQTAWRIALAAAAPEAAADPARVAAGALTAIMQAAGVDAGAVHILDRLPQHGGCARLLAAEGLPPDFARRFGEVPLENALLVTRALRAFQTMLSATAALDPLTQATLDETGADLWLVVPFHCGATTGALSLLGKRLPPEADEMASLALVAELLGQVIAAAQARQGEARARARARFLAEVSRAFGLSLDLPQVLESAVRLASPVLGEWVLIYLREGDLLPVRAIYHADAERQEAIRALFTAYPVKVGEGVAGNAVLTGQPRIFREFDEAALHTLAPRDSTVYVEALRRLKSWACFPLMARGRGLGALILATERRHLDDDDLEIAAAFAEIVATAVDNARLYEAERALRRDAEIVQEQLAAADRQKDEFLSIAAHELRTPLTSAQGFAQVLLRRVRGNAAADQRLSEGLTIMEGQLRRIGALLNELLDLARVQTGTLPLRPEPTDLNALVHEVCERLRALPGGNRIEVIAPEKPLVAVVDRDRIEQIVINLVENGLKYSPGGEPVTVTLAQEEGTITLRVRDRGLGVPREARPHMFQRFYRIPDAAHQQISGLGIGLYICQEIAHRHGGEIVIEQPDGPGSIFTLRLPLLPSPAPPPD